MTSTTLPNILLVDDDPAVIQLLSSHLGCLGQLRFATTGTDALRLSEELTPDLVLLDGEMPDFSGFEVCSRMKKTPGLADVPIIFVTSHNDSLSEQRGLELGAVDFIAKPVHAPIMLARVKTQLRLKQMTDELRQLATTDPLTGVFNRRVFDQVLSREWQRSLRGGHAMSLLMVDVDCFKLYNDHYGHPAGDACLRQVSAALRQATRRPTDVVARIGGEEFVLLLPHTNAAGAEVVAQAVHSALAAMALPHAASLVSSFVTVSVGIALFDGHSFRAAQLHNARDVQRPWPDAQDLVAVADKALYAAKQAGRGRSCSGTFEELVATVEPS